MLCKRYKYHLWDKYITQNEKNQYKSDKYITSNSMFLIIERKLDSFTYKIGYAILPNYLFIGLTGIIRIIL